MILTTHARKRMQQRAIPVDFIELLCCFGIETSSRGGVDKLALSNREARHLRRRLESLLHRWDHLMDSYVVVSDNDTLIMTAHEYRRRSRFSRNSQVNH